MFIIKTFEGIYYFLKHRFREKIEHIIEFMDLIVRNTKWIIHIDVLFGWRIQERHPIIGYFLTSWLIGEHVFLEHFDEIFKKFSEKHEHLVVSLKVLIIMFTSALFALVEFNHFFLLSSSVEFISYST